MIKVCKLNQENVIRQITNGSFDNVSLSESNFADDIILSMYDQGILGCLSNCLKDKRRANSTLPFDLILSLAIAAKMKVKMSLSDIPYAIQDHRVLAKLGYNIVDTEGNLKNALMRESSLRLLLGKYNSDELFSAYNNTVQKQHHIHRSAHGCVLGCSGRFVPGSAPLRALLEKDDKSCLLVQLYMGLRSHDNESPFQEFIP